MGKRLVDRVPFAKILIGLAIVFLLSLGMCGVSIALAMKGGHVQPPWDWFLGPGAGWNILIMVLSMLGLVVTGIAWVVAAAVSGSVGEVSQPRNPYAAKDDTNLDKKE